MSEEKRKDAIKRTGQLMLQGWRLLAQCCPICYTALLSSREGQMRCPFCDLPVVAEQPGVTYEEVPQNSAIPEVDEVDDEELDNFEADLPSSLEDLRKEYDSRNKSKASSTSALLGEKMLQGWTMLSENCPVTECRGTPLMRLGKAPAAMLCVACSRNYTLNANGDLVAEGSNTKVSSKIQDTVLQQTGFSLDDAPILNLNSFSNKNDSSQKISQKLMKGWALLDKCCMLPDCSGNIPLLRDKEEKVSLH